ncbi:radical SAM protein [Marinisporobacter balticus]|uniref:4Fe-4S single cluster protein n=1 Tax=Marinisporobacter balticus TaxID=2018667 RepID=A0A4R2LB01_9FIRM|nr:radical SAM protein [Marinisporobacter balticus]TCO76455.1 4Fe-4S single cluster protein [Marinisporobacter balticus]
MEHVNTNHQLNLKGTGLTSTLRCSLKCKLCCTFSPYYNPALHFTVDKIKRTVDKYFEIVNHVGKFTISGGEPFLHQELDLIIEHISNYFDRIDIFEIITNGTIIPNDKLIRTMAKFKEKVNIMIDEYGDLSKKVADIKACFDKKEISYRIRNYGKENPHCGGWVDFGDFSRKHYSEEETIEKFNKCAYPRKLQFCFSIMNGEIHPCTPSRRCMELGIIKKDKSEYIDLFDEQVSVEEQRQKFISILNKSYLSACAYCNGLCDDSERFVPAEQLSE